MITAHQGINDRVALLLFLRSDHEVHFSKNPMPITPSQPVWNEFTLSNIMPIAHEHPPERRIRSNLDALNTYYISDYDVIRQRIY